MPSIAIDQLLIDYKSTRDELLKTADQALKVFESVAVTTSVESTKAVLEKIQSDSLKVLFLGDFKQGKSTLINAMLGKRVLPAYSIPCTGVINEIKYGEQPSAIVHYLTVEPNNQERSIRFNKINQSDIQRTKAVPVPIDQLEEFVVIKNPVTSVEGQREPRSQIGHVEIYWPLDLCRHGIEVIDSPGLNEHDIRTTITRTYLNKVDAVVFVMSCVQLGSQSEVAFITNVLREEGHRDILFACNRIDQVKQHEKDRLIEHGIGKLCKLTDLGSEGIFFLSAEMAMEGKERGYRQMVDESGLRPFEAKLNSFLVRNKGKIKLLQSTRQLLIEIDRCILDAIPQRLSILKEDLKTIEKRYEDSRPVIQGAREKLKKCEYLIDKAHENIVNEVRQRLLDKFPQIHSSIPNWINEVGFYENFELLNMQEGSAAQYKRIQDEAARKFTERLDLEYAAAIRDVVPLAVTKGWGQIEDEIGIDLREIELDVNKIRVGIFGELQSTNLVPLPTAFERVLAGTVGLFVGGFGSAYVGGTFGATEMVKSAVPSIAVGLGAIVLGITSPFLILPALAATAIAQSVVTAKNLGEQIRTRVADEVRKDAIARLPEIVEFIAREVNKRCDAVISDLKMAMNAEVRSIEESVDDVLQQKKQGEKSCAERSHVLESSRRILEESRKTLKEVVFRLAETT
jgi:GTPase SAR1 family protein